MCDFTKCKNGLHPFIRISSTTVGVDEEKVVRWCPECGAIVIDHDIDIRIMPGYYKKLTYPNITKKYGLEQVFQEEE